MKSSTRFRIAAPFVALAVLGYLCALVSVYIGWGWTAPRDILVLTGIGVGSLVCIAGVFVAVVNTAEAKKWDANAEKLRKRWAPR